MRGMSKRSGLHCGRRRAGGCGRARPNRSSCPL